MNKEIRGNYDHGHRSAVYMISSLIKFNAYAIRKH